MKKIFFTLIFLLTTFFGYSQTHFFTTDTAGVFEAKGINWEYSITYNFSVYYKEHGDDSLYYITDQKATLLINDYYGYFQLIFTHDSGVFEIYEFTYKHIEWRGENYDILSLPAKDFLGVNVAVLGIWEEPENQNVCYALVWSDRYLKDQIIYFARTDFGDNM